MSERRRGLGRGLGALIPAAPPGRQTRRSPGTAVASPTAVPVLTADRGVAAAKVAGARGAGRRSRWWTSRFHVKPTRSCPTPDGRRRGRTSPSCRSTRSRPTRASRARSSTRTPSPNWSPPSRRSACSSRSWCGRPGRTAYELIMGERRWRACREAGLDAHPGDRPGDRRREAAAGRAAGEPAPGPAEPAGRGRGLRPVAPGLQLHARAVGRPDRAFAVRRSPTPCGC